MSPRRPELHGPRLGEPLEAVTAHLLEDDMEWLGAEVDGDVAGQEAEDVDIIESRLRSLRLTGCRLTRLRLTDVVLTGCELSGLTLVDTAWSRVHLEGCRLSGLVATGAALRSVRFDECRIDGANFRMASGEAVEFHGCDLARADFYGAQLDRSRFLRCDLTGAEMSRVTLRDAHFHGSTMEGLRGVASMSGATIDSTQMLPLARQLLEATGITVDDEPPGDER